MVRWEQLQALGLACTGLATGCPDPSGGTHDESGVTSIDNLACSPGPDSEPQGQAMAIDPFTVCCNDDGET